MGGNPMTDTKIPTMDSMNQEFCEHATTCDGMFIKPREAKAVLRDQRNDLHAIATELKARVEGMDERENCYVRDLGAACAKATELEAKLNLAATDLADTDTHVREIAKQVCGEALATGSSDYVPCISDLVDMITERYDERDHAMQIKMNDGWGAAQEAEHKLERIEKAIRSDDDEWNSSLPEWEMHYGQVMYFRQRLITILEKENEDGNDQG
jgi:hypothetical protein